MKTPHAAAILLAAIFGTMSAQYEASAQELADRPYDAITAAYDAHQYAELRRRHMLGRQLDTIDWLNWWGGRPLRGSVGIHRPPVWRSDLYAFGVDSGSVSPYGFLSWPYVPGDIWGFPNDGAAPQPIGQRQVKIGARRWESHPVFAAGGSAPAPPSTASPVSGGPREF